MLKTAIVLKVEKDPVNDRFVGFYQCAFRKLTNIMLKNDNAHQICGHMMIVWYRKQQYCFNNFSLNQNFKSCTIKKLKPR